MTTNEFYAQRVKDELNALAHKDRHDMDDRIKIAGLESELRKLTEKPRQEPIKNVYNEMVAQIASLVRPNGIWKGNPAKEWHELRKAVVEFIFEKKGERDNEGKSDSGGS